GAMSKLGGLGVVSLTEKLSTVHPKTRTQNRAFAGRFCCTAPTGTARLPDVVPKGLWRGFSSAPDAGNLPDWGVLRQTELETSERLPAASKHPQPVENLVLHLKMLKRDLKIAHESLWCRKSATRE